MIHNSQNTLMKSNYSMISFLAFLGGNGLTAIRHHGKILWNLYIVIEKC